MLLERATGLAEKVSRYQQLKSAAAEAELFRTRASQVTQAAALVATALETLQRFASAGVEVSFRPANADVLIERARALQEIAAKDPAKLAEPPFNFRYEFTDRLTGIATGALQAVQHAWAAHVGKVAPTGSDELLDAFGRIAQLRPAVTRIRQCRERIAALAASAPADPAAALATLDRLVGEHAAAMRELRSEDMPISIVKLIAAAGEPRGAPLGWLTDENRAWLEARGLADAFRLRLV